jgi:hypothetical protein
VVEMVKVKRRLTDVDQVVMRLIRALYALQMHTYQVRYTDIELLVDRFNGKEEQVALYWTAKNENKSDDS